MCGMNTTDDAALADVRLAGAQDVEWVADLLDTLAEGDLDTTAELLESLARRLRKASKARRALSQVPSDMLRAIFVLRSGQDEGRSCL